MVRALCRTPALRDVNSIVSTMCIPDIARTRARATKRRFCLRYIIVVSPSSPFRRCTYFDAGIIYKYSPTTDIIDVILEYVA
jgi:hypothetical protein